MAPNDLDPPGKTLLRALSESRRARTASCPPPLDVFASRLLEVQHSIPSAIAVDRESGMSHRQCGSFDHTQPSDTAVSPPEMPKRIGFRQVTGPSHGPPPTAQRTPLAMPLASSITPTAASGQARRSSHQAGASDRVGERFMRSGGDALPPVRGLRFRHAPPTMKFCHRVTPSLTPPRTQHRELGHYLRSSRRPA